MPSQPFEVDVLCVGHATFDLTMTVDHHPGPDEKCTATRLIACGGGPAANAAVAAARLGGTSAFAGYLGDDFFGCKHISELQAEGVDTSLVVRGPHPTPLSVVIVKPDGQRTVVNHRAETPFIQPRSIDFNRCTPRAILFDGHEPSISAELAKSLRGTGIATVLDAGSMHAGTMSLIHTVDYVIASEKFSYQFTREREPLKALSKLSGIAPYVAITLGERGLVWSSGGMTGTVPAFQVQARDTTGAGDTFHGAFALQLARGESIDRALVYASAAAALSCTVEGARPSIPNDEQVAALMKKRR